jgi:hypothetical protein
MPTSNTWNHWSERPGADTLSCICTTPVYLTNTDRERLGLLGHPSDVPDDVVAAAESALEAATGAVCPAPADEAPKKRSRTSQGQFVADDPTTPAVNEAYEAG